MILDGINIKVEKKQIKNIYIRIKPPNGEVILSAPVGMNNEDILVFAVSKIEWIKNHQQKYKNYKEQQFVTGEKIMLWGNSYNLFVAEGRECVLKSDDSIIIYTNKDSSLQHRVDLMNGFYKKELSAKMTEYVPLCESKTGLKANCFRIRNMKTRWGSCNPSAKRIWLSSALAQKPVCCLEYVIIHELCHFIEPNHGAKFKSLMDKFYPQWREIKKILNGGCDG